MQVQSWEYGWRDGWTQCVYIDRNEYSNAISNEFY